MARELGMNPKKLGKLNKQSSETLEDAAPALHPANLIEVGFVRAEFFDDGVRPALFDDVSQICRDFSTV
jgi:hypothetical protein